MARKISKTAIGAFVIGAIALIIATVLIFGAGRFFTEQYTFITYFDGSVKGLSVGSPVMFRGVRVGSVSDISIVFDPRGRVLKIPVIFSLEPAKFKGTEAEMPRDQESIRRIVKEYGLRTQLQTLSYLTGQLMVGLDFFPQKPAGFVGLNKQYPEIPSVPTPLEELQRTFENLPFRQMVQNLNSTLAGIDQLVRSTNTKEATDTLKTTLADVRSLVRHINAKVDPLVANLDRTAGAAEATLAEARETVAVAGAGIRDLVATARQTLETAQGTLKQSEETLQSFSGDSQLSSDLQKTLKEISATARSLRQLSDYLERHPESLLRGKPREKGE